MQPVRCGLTASCTVRTYLWAPLRALALGFFCHMPTRYAHYHTHRHGRTACLLTFLPRYPGTLRSRHGGKAVRLQIGSGNPFRGTGLRCIFDLVVEIPATVYERREFDVNWENWCCRK